MAPCPTPQDIKAFVGALPKDKEQTKKVQAGSPGTQLLKRLFISAHHLCAALESGTNLGASACPSSTSDASGS